MQHLITDIQRFSLNDGPGIRTTVFFKGCNMRCSWCHNPETLSPLRDLLYYPAKCIGCGKCFSVCPNGVHRLEDSVHHINREKCTRCGACAAVCYADALVISGREMRIEEILREIRQDTAYYQASGGGVTLSGGEVLCHVPFALELAAACRAEGIHVAVETNLSLPWEEAAPLLSAVDLVMADCKLADDAAHRLYTGVSNRHVSENLAKLTDVPLIVRTPLIPGVTATSENLAAIGQLLAGKTNLLCWELLNFNPLGASKYDGLGAENGFVGAKPYTATELEVFRTAAAASGVTVKIGG